MKKIIIKENFAFLYLNNNFYDINSIKNTLRIYQEFFKAKIDETKKYYILKIEKINEKSNSIKLEILINEFLNYLLSNLKQNQKENIKFSNNKGKNYNKNLEK